jgi:hypothetical protein
LIARQRITTRLAPMMSERGMSRDVFSASAAVTVACGHPPYDLKMSTIAGVRKIPEPIVEPTAIMIRSKRESERRREAMREAGTRFVRWCVW